MEKTERATFETHLQFIDKNDHCIEPQVALSYYKIIAKLDEYLQKKNLSIKISLDEEGGWKKIIYIIGLIGSANYNYLQDITTGFWEETTGKTGKEIGKEISNFFLSASKSNKIEYIENKLIYNNKQCYNKIQQKDFTKYILEHQDENNDDFETQEIELKQPFTITKIRIGIKNTNLIKDDKNKNRFIR